MNEHETLQEKFAPHHDLINDNIYIRKVTSEATARESQLDSDDDDDDEDFESVATQTTVRNLLPVAAL